MARTRRQWGGIWLVVLAFVACSDSQGGGCGGCNDIPYAPYPSSPLPGGALQTDGVRARLTQSTLDFLGKNLEPLLSQFFVVQGREARYFFDASVLPPNSPVTITSGSYIAFDLDNIQQGTELTWLDPDASGRPGLQVALRNAHLFLDMTIALQVDVFPPAACRIQSATAIPALTVDELRFDMRLDVVDNGTPIPGLSATTENIHIDLLNNREDVVFAMTITPCDASGPPETFCSSPVCQLSGASCAEVCGLVDLFTQLGGFLVQVLQPVFDEFAPTIAGFISDALGSALAAVPLGLEAELDMLGLLGPVFSNAKPLHVKVAASDQVKVAGSALGRGLDLGLSSGLTPAEVAACAQGVPAPNLAPMMGPPPDFSGWIEVNRPNSNDTYLERYHLVATVSQALLHQGLWSLFQSGFLCFNLGSREIERLAGGVFNFTAGVLQTFDQRLVELTHPQAPLLAALRASGPPIIRVGAGHMVSTGVDDPLFEVAINDLDLGLFMLIDDVQHRVSGLRADLALELGITRTPTGALELVVEDIRVAEITQTYNELVPLSDLSALFELIIDLAVGSFLGDSLKFEIDLNETISDALGGIPLELRINSVRRDFGPTGAAFLSLYATLCNEADIDDPHNATCFVPFHLRGRNLNAYRVLADAQSVYTAKDPQRFPSRRWHAQPSGEITLDVSPPLSDETPHEYQWRIDGGPWSTFQTAVDGYIHAKSARLYALGEHRIEVRARAKGFPSTRTDPVELSVWVDPESPVVRAERIGHQVHLRGDDLGAPDQVQFWVRHAPTVGSPYGDFTPTEHVIDVAGLTGELEIVGRDPAGNVSEPIWIWLGDEATTASGALDVNQASLSAGGCHQTPSAIGWLGAVVIAWGLLLRRRRQA